MAKIRITYGIVGVLLAVSLGLSLGYTHLVSPEFILVQFLILLVVAYKLEVLYQRLPDGIKHVVFSALVLMAVIYALALGILAYPIFR